MRSEKRTRRAQANVQEEEVLIRVRSYGIDFWARGPRVGRQMWVPFVLLTGVALMGAREVARALRGPNGGTDVGPNGGTDVSNF